MIHPTIDCAGRELVLDRPRICGIVNVTPDSFSDGGAHFDAEAAVRHGLALVAQGADLLDVGGESTRPGAEAVSEDEELRRVIPVIDALARATTVPISVDTSKPGVMRAAVRAGAGHAGGRSASAICRQTRHGGALRSGGGCRAIRSKPPARRWISRC